MSLTFQLVWLSMLVTDTDCEMLGRVNECLMTGGVE